MAEHRPYFHSSTAELEEIFKSHKQDIPTIKKLMRELEHRKRPRARTLLEHITKFLASQNINVANVEEEDQQQLLLYPPARPNTPKSTRQKKDPALDSLQCHLDGVWTKPTSQGGEGIENENTGEKTGGEERQAKSEMSDESEVKENVPIKAQSSDPPHARINLEKVIDRQPKTVPVTKETFWRSLFRLLTGKTQKP